MNRPVGTEKPRSWKAMNDTTNPLGVLLTVKFRQPSHEFTFGVGMTFICYPLVLTPLV
jgi:hypothetical protein